MPIISATHVDPKELSGLRDPLVGQDIDAMKPLVRCVNCDTVYFQASYESLVASTRGQCLNCKGDKYETLAPRVGASRGNRWDKGKKASPGVSAKSKTAPEFRVPLAYRGPILPAPSTGECWSDVLDNEQRRKIAELKYGNGGLEPPPLTVVWCGEDKVVMARNEKVFCVDLQSGKSELIFSCPDWRGRRLDDVDCSSDASIVAVVGNTFFERARPNGHRRWSWSADNEYSCNPDWNRVIFSRKSYGKCVHTGHTTYEKTKDWLLGSIGFMGFGEKTQYKGDEFFIYENVYSKPTRSFLLRGGGHLWDPHRVLWSPSEKYLAIAGDLGSSYSTTGTIDLSDTRSEIELSRCNVEDGRSIGCFAWHPTRDIYATAFYHGEWGPPHGFMIIDAATQKVLFEQTIERNHITTSLDWSADGRFIALGGHDQAVFLWDFEAGAAVSLLGHHEQVEHVHFSPDGQRLVSSSSDRKTIIWGCERPNPKLAQFDGLIDHDYQRRMKGSPWSPSGRRLVAFSDGGIRVMQIG